MELPYITSELPGIGGRLRAQPDHFVVDEIALYEPSGEGQHLYVNITKVELTTKDVQRKLVRLFGLRETDVGFAGMKDKNACTTQTFSLSVGHPDRDFVDSAAARIENEMPVTVNWVRLHGNKLRLGHLVGNRFRIVISDLPGTPVVSAQMARNVVDRLIADGMPNFFGPQRFGAGGNNVDKGLAVLQRKNYVKDRWLRRFLVSAYQSYLCNCYLADRVKSGAFYSLLSGDVAKKHDTGGLFDVEDLAVEQPRFDAHEISFTAPLFGPKMRMASADAGDLETRILDNSPITLEDLRKAKVEGTRRQGRLLTPDLTIASADEGVVVEFSLTKGGFATTILRELMKSDTAERADSD
jgi:tRNA pseudouridine13 synthase